METDRLELARLYHRFGFGPRPGEFEKALSVGVEATRVNLLTVPALDLGAQSVLEPEITDIGKNPA